LPSFILEQDKQLPGTVNDAAGMLNDLFGGEGAKGKALHAIGREFQNFPDLRRWPAWAVRSGGGTWLMKKRRRKARKQLFRWTSS
jgi:hypothetical protein